MNPETDHYVADFRSLGSVSAGNMWAILAQYFNYKLSPLEREVAELRTTLFKIQNDLESVKEEKK